MDGASEDAEGTDISIAVSGESGLPFSSSSEALRESSPTPVYRGEARTPRGPEEVMRQFTEELSRV